MFIYGASVTALQSQGRLQQKVNKIKNKIRDDKCLEFDSNSPCVT